MPSTPKDNESPLVTCETICIETKAKIASFEVKLSTIRLWMDRKKKEMLETYDNRLQFDQLLTDRGQELLQQPFRGKAGAFSEQMRMISSFTSALQKPTRSFGVSSDFHQCQLSAPGTV